MCAKLHSGHPEVMLDYPRIFLVGLIKSPKEDMCTTLRPTTWSLSIKCSVNAVISQSRIFVDVLVVLNNVKSVKGNMPLSIMGIGYCASNYGAKRMCR